MVYKIFVLASCDEKNPKWTPVMDKVVNPDNTFNYFEWKTESEDELEQKLLSIIRKRGTSNIRVMSDIEYDLDVLFKDTPEVNP